MKKLTKEQVHEWVEWHVNYCSTIPKGERAEKAREILGQRIDCTYCSFFFRELYVDKPACGKGHIDLFAESCSDYTTEK